MLVGGLRCGCWHCIAERRCAGAGFCLRAYSKRECVVQRYHCVNGRCCALRNGAASQVQIPSAEDQWQGCLKQTSSAPTFSTTSRASLACAARAAAGVAAFGVPAAARRLAIRCGRRSARYRRLLSFLLMFLMLAPGPASADPVATPQSSSATALRSSESAVTSALHAGQKMSIKSPLRWHPNARRGKAARAQWPLGCEWLVLAATSRCSIAAPYVDALPGWCWLMRGHWRPERPAGPRSRQGRNTHMER